LASGLVCLGLVGSGGYLARVAGQNPAATAQKPGTVGLPADARDEFRQKVLPVIQDNCITCHNDDEYAGDFSMEAFEDLTQVNGTPEFWAKVHDKITAGEMPPKTQPRLAAGDVRILTGWIERTYKLTSNLDPATADPGRVTARRLNRTEYNNTIRDLLGVTRRPADEFPVDDSGYGFDNIGDVLTMSPMLMEKYLRSARAVSKAAVFGESYPETPMLLVTLHAKKAQDDLPTTGNEVPFSIRGALYGTYHFPVDGEYEFRWRYVNFRGDETQQSDTPPAGARGAGGRGGRGAAAAGQASPAEAPTGAAANGAGQPGPVTGGSATAGSTTQGAPAPSQGATGQAGRGAGQAGRGGNAGRGRAALTPEEYRAREEALRLQAPPELMVFTIDGTKVYDYTVEGSANFNYTHPDNVARVKVTAGDHALRISYPRLANLDDPTVQYNRDGRRKLFIEHLDIVGPFNPSKAPPAGYKKIFICGEPGRYTAECARRIVENLATRAYRRPATAEEVQRLLGLVNQVQRRDSFEEGIRAAIEAILISPSFLFRIEREPAVPQQAYRINDFELASRLSYFLWNSMPDDALFEAARANRLHDKATLDAQVRRMLADPKASALVETFGEQWLNLRLMDRVKPDAVKFKQVDDELLDAMRTETRMFLTSVFRDDRSILDLIDAKYTFVNGPLARYYGIPGVDGEAFQRVVLNGDQRGGLVSQASILSISSYATRTSPVLRGKWVLDNLLGSPPPPPPDNIPPLETTDLGTAASLRERLEKHRADPTCGACHNQMDPIGFALENYDAAGGWRTKDGNFDIDNSGTLPDGRVLVGPTGLKTALRSLSGAFAEHFTDRLMTYALGRGLERSDRPVLRQIAADLPQQDHRFSAVVSAIVNSRPFQMRSRVTR
jgi:hypothetical protein